MDMVKIISMALVGCVGGFLVPMLTQKFIDYKGRQKNRMMPKQPQYMSIWCKVICAVFSMLGLGVCGYFQPSWTLLVVSAVIWILGMVVLLMDIRIRIIPNEAVLGFLVLSIVFRVIVSGWLGLLNSLITMIITMVIWTSLGGVLGFGKVGAGDVKLCGVIGFMYGYPSVVVPVLVMAISMLLFCVGGLLIRKITLKTMFAMGPYIVIGMLVGLPYLFYTML